MDRIYLLYVYVKSAQADLAPSQIKTLAHLLGGYPMLESAFRILAMAGIACLTVAASPVHAGVIGFNLTLTAISDAPDFGTGVSKGDTFTGSLFFDASDLTPDGNRARTSLPGPDSLTIAGIPYDAVLHSLTWQFIFDSGAPTCFTGTGPADTDCIAPGGLRVMSGDRVFPPVPGIQTVIGRVLHMFSSVGDAHVDWLSDAFSHQTRFSFTYSITAMAVPEPGAFALLATGLAGLGIARRRRTKKAIA